MKISIEKRKVKGGRLSIRLAYYYGYTKSAEGKIVHQRKFEKLDLFLYEKPKTSLEKQHNKDVIRLAETILAKRVIEAESGKHGFNDKVKPKINFIVYLDDILKEKQRATSKSNAVGWDCTIKQFKKFYTGDELLSDELTPELIKDFADYLKNHATQKTGSPLSQGTQSAYYKKIIIAIRQLFRSGELDTDTTKDLNKLIRPLKGKREYLVLEELKSLAKTDCRNEILKRAS